MYRMLIADDRSDERKVIKFLLKKFDFQFSIEEASNGKEALEKLKHSPTDILFTDVKMPFMDGIKLASVAKELYPNIQIIFFSGHDDFEYIKKALSLKVVDYILKPVNPLEFQKTISSVLQTTEQLQKILIQKENNALYLKDHILYRIINKTSLEVLESEYPTIDLSYLKDYTRLFLIQFDEALFDQIQAEDNSFSCHDAIFNIINDPCDYINLNPFQSLLLFKNERHASKHYKELAMKIENQISSLYGKNCYLSVSSEIKGSNDILRAYEEAEAYLEDRFFLSDTYIFSGDTSYLSNEDYSWQDNYLLQAVQKDIQFKDIYSLKHDISKFFEKYQNSPSLSHIYIRFICCNLLQILYEELPEYRKSEFKHKVTSIYSTQNLQEIRVLIDNVLDEVIKKLEIEQQSPNHAINVVKQYIYEHYNENLSLELLADKVFLSYRYLSSLFIQETGCGINKYIKNVRMDKAKELLFNTNMKVSDICKAVGYSNVSYFCKSFKDNFGVTPEKYREIHP